MYNPMVEFFEELLDYSHQCNQNLIQIIMNNEHKVTDKALQLINHILNAHQIWNNRIQSESTPFGVWQIHDLQALSDIDQTNYNHSVRILRQYDFNDHIVYVNSRSESFKRTVRNILFHIVNHTTYHRGQIATEFRHTGIEPLVTDYIYFRK